MVASSQAIAAEPERIARAGVAGKRVCMGPRYRGRRAGRRAGPRDSESHARRPGRIKRSRLPRFAGWSGTLGGARPLTTCNQRVVELAGPARDASDLLLHVGRSLQTIHASGACCVSFACHHFRTAVHGDAVLARVSLWRALPTATLPGAALPGAALTSATLAGATIAGAAGAGAGAACAAAGVSAADAGARRGRRAAAPRAVVIIVATTRSSHDHNRADERQTKVRTVASQVLHRSSHKGRDGGHDGICEGCRVPLHSRQAPLFAVRAWRGCLQASSVPATSGSILASTFMRARQRRPRWHETPFGWRRHGCVVRERMGETHRGLFPSTRIPPSPQRRHPPQPLENRSPTEQPQNNPHCRLSPMLDTG